MKLSIVTINRNNAEGLRKTLDSVACQTWHDFEHIIVDGASTDCSVEYIQEYADKSHPYSVLWLSETDSGVYDAMNKGVSISNGEYLIFMNSGDCFASNTVLENIERLLSETKIIAGDAAFSDNSKRFEAPDLFLPRTLLNSGICHQAEFIHRSLFSILGTYSLDYKVLSDFEFNMKASCMKVSYQKVDLLIALVEPGGLSNTLLDEMKVEGDRILKNCLPKGVIADYEIWNNQKTFGHPCVEWAVNKKWPLMFMKLLYKVFKYG
ncbi:MAG: glycosyltransferase [Bacteroidales bacterium]|nr:glycosyltransferase [Bacteroidales bacterium]